MNQSKKFENASGRVLHGEFHRKGNIYTFQLICSDFYLQFISEWTF